DAGRGPSRGRPWPARRAHSAGGSRSWISTRPRRRRPPRHRRRERHPRPSRPRSSVLDVRAIREDPDRFRRGLARRNLADAVDTILELDGRRRALTIRVEELRAEQNRAGKGSGGAEGEEKQRLIAEVAKVSAELKELEPQLDQVEAGLADLLARTPKPPHQTAPHRVTARG